MSVSELVEWLKTQDQGAVVEVVIHTSGRSYYEQGGTAKAVEFKTELSDYEDLRWNSRIPPDAPYYGKRTLRLGVLDA